MRHGGRTSWSALVIAGMSMAITPRPALAGMPSLTLTDIARLRVEAISFFLLLLLLSAWAIKGLWNLLRRDFVRLPRLSYVRALGLVAIWGLLFLLVLTMISGARELMTPGAWEKRGAIYHLTSTTQPVAPTEANRRARLLALKTALWEYARSHDGDLPTDAQSSGIPPSVWQTPDITRASYIYIPGRKAGVGSSAVACEPHGFYYRRFGLTSDGEVREISREELEAASAAEKAR